MKIKYQNFNFRPARLALIGKCNEILDRYHAAGYDMTLRQLYYQLVSADEIPNNQKEYNKLGEAVNDARLAGLIDWNYIVDRTRSLKSLSHWSSPSEIMQSVASQYRIDKWAGQPFRPEVWIEKDALAGVFERVCSELDVPYFSCRGYTSQSEMWGAAMRMKEHRAAGQVPYILHFGDHDPSGIDMSRDIKDRIAMFGVHLEFDRLALNIDQVQQYDPPPNPAKITDSRAVGYIEQFGDESWELDALEPDVLAALVREAIEKLRDPDTWDEAEENENRQRRALRAISDNFPAVEDFVEELSDDED